MRGDFSRSGLAQNANFEAVLQQQGRVLTDADWNDQTWLSDRWRRDAARAARAGAGGRRGRGVRRQRGRRAGLEPGGARSR